MNRLRIFPTATALLAGMFILILPQRGPAHSPDIQVYLHAANSLLVQGEWLNPTDNDWWIGEYYTEWAPLYPMILATFQWAGLDPYATSQYFNAALYAAVAYVLVSRAKRYRVLIALLLCLPSAFFTFTVTWAEPPMVLMTIGFVFALQDAHPRRMGLFAAVALLLKYSAAPLVLFGAGWLWLTQGWRAALRFVWIPVVAIAPWMLRNWVLVGSPLGYRLPAKYTWQHNAQVLVETIGIWILLIICGVCVQWGVGQLWQRLRLPRFGAYLSS